MLETKAFISSLSVTNINFNIKMSLYLQLSTNNGIVKQCFNNALIVIITKLSLLQLKIEGHKNISPVVLVYKQKQRQKLQYCEKWVTKLILQQQLAISHTLLLYSLL